jgi:tetratricopeptide (TPR) repeat protein
MKKYNILAITLMIGGLSTAQTLEEAIKKTDNERFDLASGLYKSLISKDANNGNNYYYFGESLVKDNKLDSAKIIWEKGLTNDIENPMNYVGIAKYQWFKGDTTSANINIEKAFEITKKKTHPKKAEVLRQVASIYIETEKFKKLDASITLLNKAIELEPNNPENYIVLGDALELKTPENGSPAIKNYNIALDLDPKSPKAILRTAKLYERAQNPKLANQKFKEAQALDPNFAPAYRENAELNMKFEQFDNAIENWEKYLNLNNTLEVRYRYATALFQASKFELAVKELNNLQAEGFNNMYIERMLAYSYCQVEGDENAAVIGLKHMEAFFKLASTDQILASDFKYKGLLFSKNGQDDLALIELEKATTIDKDNQTDALGDIAEIYIKKKDYSNAIKTFNRKTINGDPSSLSVKELYNVAKAYYFGEKNYKMADSCFANLAERSPTYAPAYLWRARSAYNLDPKNELWLAKDHFVKFLEVLGDEEMKSNSNKSSVIEACKYLGDYYVKNEANKDIELAKKYWGIVRELSPEDNQAKSFFAVHKL